MMMRQKNKSYNVFHQFKKIIDNISTKYLNLIRGNKPSTFTRRRKVSVELIFLFMFAFKGKSYKNELECFYQDISIPKNVSTWGFIKQRIKFNPEAIKEMNKDYLIDYYDKSHKDKKIKDYYILAGDGSDVVVPSTKENKEIFGYRKDGNRQPAMAKVSVMYDCINKMILDIQLETYKFSEIELVNRHLKITREILKDKKIIYIFDRGYPSIRLILDLIDHNEKFIFRLKSTDFKKEKKLIKSNDEWVNIIYDRARANQFRSDFEFMERLLQLKQIPLRFVQVPIKTNDVQMIEEILLTNLDTNEFSLHDLKELYHLRWEVETSYRELKSKQKLEEFSGTKPQIIVQDIYINVFVFNFIHDIITEIKDIPQEKYKYKMKINTNYAIGMIKTNFLKIFMEKRIRKRNKLIIELIDKISRNLVPIRNKRNYSRHLTPINKSRMSYKYSY